MATPEVFDFFDVSEPAIVEIAFDASEPALLEIGFLPPKPKFRTFPSGYIEFASAVNIPPIDDDFLQTEDVSVVVGELPSVDCLELLDNDSETTIVSQEIKDCAALGYRSMTERDATVPFDLNQLGQRMTPWEPQKAGCVQLDKSK
jgi:hypothetical protein